MPTASSNFRALFAGILTIVVWASAYPAIRVGLRAYTPGQLASLRFLVASIVFGAYLALRRETLPRGWDLLRVTLAGAFGITAYNLLLNTGELTISAGAASLIINCMPVFAALLAVFFLHERVRLIGWIGIAISFGGVAIIAICDPRGLHFGFGALLTFVAAFCSAFMGFLQKPLLARYSSIAITACIMWSGALFLTPFLPSAFSTALHSAPVPTFAVIFLGIFPAAIGYLSWAFVLSRFTLSQTASMLYLIPFATLIISFFWLGEIPNAASIGGGIMSILGVILLTRYGRRSTVVPQVQCAQAYES